MGCLRGTSNQIWLRANIWTIRIKKGWIQRKGWNSIRGKNNGYKRRIKKENSIVALVFIKALIRRGDQRRRQLLVT